VRANAPVVDREGRLGPVKRVSSRGNIAKVEGRASFVAVVVGNGVNALLDVRSAFARVQVVSSRSRRSHGLL
jgi:hypothetical protein